MLGNLLIPYIVYVSSCVVKIKTKKLNTLTNIYVPVVIGLSIMSRVPAIIRLINEEKMKYNGETFAEWFFLICFTWIAAFSLRSLILFCSVVAADFRRRYYLVRFLTKLLQPGRHAFHKYFRTLENGQLIHPPHLFPNDWEHNRELLESCSLETLDLTDAITVYNWSRLRAFLLDFGLRFLRREEGALSIFTVEMAAICLFYFSMIYFEVIEIDAFETLFVFFAAFGVFAPAFWSLRTAEQINHLLIVQRSILADKRLRIAHEYYHLEDDKSISKNMAKKMFEDSRKSAEMMHHIVRLIEFEKFRIRLLGYEIDTTVTGVFAFVLGSVGFACARLMASRY